MKIPFPLIGILLLLATTGCVKVDRGILEKSYPEKHLYALEALRAGPPVPSRSLKSLRVRSFQISPMFKGRSFIYRLDENRYQGDFYNRFFADPSDMVASTVASWLGDSALFRPVSTTATQLGADYFLEGTVETLYGDYRSPEAPRSVLEIQFLLITAPQGQVKLVFERSYQASLPVAPDSPEALVTGWDQALTQILSRFEQDLSGLSL